MRTGPYSYHDRVFQEEYLALAVEAKKHYEAYVLSVLCHAQLHMDMVR